MNSNSDSFTTISSPNSSFNDILLDITYYPTFFCNIQCQFSISEERFVYASGKNYYGNLGIGTDNNKIISIPENIPQLCDIKMIACGDYHTVCLDLHGKVFTFGRNIEGQLGIGNKKIKTLNIPNKVESIPFISYISCGKSFTVCLSDNGNVFSFGENKFKQLGIDNSYKNSFSPLQIPQLCNIELLECGNSWTISKTLSGDYYSWGNGINGELGQRFEILTYPNLCLNWPKKIVLIKCGCFHSLFLTSFGHVYGCGSNEHGQLGYNTRIYNKINNPTIINDLPIIKRIETGPSSSYCIDFNNKLWVFGYNGEGQLGLGDMNNRYKPTQNILINEIIDISKGGTTIFIKESNNKIYSFGYNESIYGTNPENFYQLKPLQIFKEKEELWITNQINSRAKSARK